VLDWHVGIAVNGLRGATGIRFMLCRELNPTISTTKFTTFRQRLLSSVEAKPCENWSSDFSVPPIAARRAPRPSSESL
jgi:hypothetical protein